MIDLRSDTVTVPTQKMREAMLNAEVGDDVYGEDPTVNALEELGAKLMGKEKALFVASGTMGNQICINVQTEPGTELICQDTHHTFKYEVGGIAALSGVQAKAIKGVDGCYDLNELKHAIRDTSNIHFPRTRLITMENTHNMAGGMAVPLSHMSDVYDIARENGLKVHLDGARIFHAALYLNCEAKEIAQYTDSVMFCLSKALASPVGSLIAGDAEFIDKARYIRKRLGGGMRQVGVLAACGLISLTDMLKRLPEDHDNAKYLAEGIASVPGLYIDTNKVHTNIVIFSIADKKMPADTLVGLLKEKGVLCGATDDYSIRFIPHYENTREELDQVIAALNDIMRA